MTACPLFEQGIFSADRIALPWAAQLHESARVCPLRHATCITQLLQTLLHSKEYNCFALGTEAVAYLQRTLNRFPVETEGKPFAAALCKAVGSTLLRQRVSGSKYLKSFYT